MIMQGISILGRFLRPLLPHIGIALALGLAIWWIGREGEKRAEARMQQQVMAQAILAERHTRRIEAALGRSIASIDTRLARRVDAIDALHVTRIQPEIRKEIVRETRFSDPDLGLSVGLFEAVNAARAETARPPGPARRDP